MIEEEMHEPEDVVDQLVSEARGGKKKRKKNSDAAEREMPDSGVPSFRNHEELDAVRSGTERPLPQPEENVRTLDDLMAKYRLGIDHDFYVEVHRVWPKIFPGGTPAEGLYDTYQQSVTEEFVQTEYGGGKYRAIVKGPRPNGEPGMKHYGSYTFNVAGEPNYKRVPRAVQAQQARNADQPVVGPVMVSGGLGDNPKLVEKAFDVVTGQLDSEREERRRLEDGGKKGHGIDESVFSKIAAAHERRADDVQQAAREQIEHERVMLKERLEEERGRVRLLEDKVSNMQNQPPAPQIDIGEQFAKIAGVLKGDGEITNKVLDQVLGKHKEELQAVREAHQREIDAMRAGHTSEMQMLRESHGRMAEAERQQADARVLRVDDQLKSEREERRRDRERWDEQLRDRELQWKDRQQAAIDSANAQAEARYNTMRTSLENRIEFLNGEIDRMRREIEDLRAKDIEVRDPVLQMQKARELADLAKGMFGQPVDSSGGIGGNHEEPGFGKLLEKIGGDVPQILDALGRAFNSGGGGGGGVAQPSIVMTPQGPAQVVQTPQGPMLIPMQGSNPQQLPRGGGGRSPQRQVMPDENEIFAEEERRRRRQKQQSTPKRTSRVPEQQVEATQSTPDIPPDVEKMAIKEITRLIDESVMGADEVEEFVEKVIKNYPEPILKQVVQYDVGQLLQAIASNPETRNSAALTPGGQRFVKDAFYQLRKTMGVA